MMKTQALVTAAFMAAGLNTDQAKLNAILDHWDAGCYELHEQLVAFVPYCDALCIAGRNYTGEFPGMFEYEVTELFGIWFAEQILLQPSAAMVPSIAKCRENLYERTFAFFVNGMGKGDDSDFKIGLTRALMSVPLVWPEGFHLNQYNDELAPPPAIVKTGWIKMQHAAWADKYRPGPRLSSLDEVVKTADPLTVWTEIESDGESVITNGLHHVNRQAYYICGVAVEAGAMIEVEL